MALHSFPWFCFHTFLPGYTLPLPLCTLHPPETSHRGLAHPKHSTCPPVGFPAAVLQLIDKGTKVTGVVRVFSITEDDEFSNDHSSITVLHPLGRKVPKCSNLSPRPHLPNQRESILATSPILNRLSLHTQTQGYLRQGLQIQPCAR